MKKIIFSILVILLAGILVPQKSISQNKLKGRISFSGAFALYPMAVRWADEFKKLNPEVKIDISAGGAGKGMTDVLNNMVDIGMVSRDIYPEEVKKGAYAIPVVKDAVVPVISAQNPALKEILAVGLKTEAGNDIFITGKYHSWNQLGTVKLKAPIHVYTRSDACGAAEVWAKYFGQKQEDLLGSAVFGDPGLALAIKKDPIGLGYNNIGYVYDFKTKQQVAGIRILPLDLNKNGKIDPEEDFYETMDKLIEAIAKNKFPSPPARDLYFVLNNKPKDKIVIEFLKWALSDGQKFVNETGYINLPKEKIQAELKKLN